MGKTPPQEKEAEGSPRKKALRVDDAARMPPPRGRPAAGVPLPLLTAPEFLKRMDDLARMPSPLWRPAVGVPLPTVPEFSKRVDDMARMPPPLWRPAVGVPLPTVSEFSKRVDDAARMPPPLWRPAAGVPRPLPPRVDDAARMNPPLWRPAAGAPLPPVPKFPKLTVEGAKRASDAKRCKCNHVVTESAIDELNAIKEVLRSPNSKDTMACYDCWRDAKEKIVRVSPEKNEILICVTCLDHLCCGSGSIAYPFGHSRAHALKTKHWFALLYYDPVRGYCFKCNAEVKTAVKCQIGVNPKSLPPPPFVGQTGVKANPKKVEMTGKVQAESQPSGVGFDLGDKWHSYETRSSDAQGYAIRGIPNLGNTCYMNAVLQCLFALGKLRERMLKPDCPKGVLPEVLQELFVEASSAGVDVLDPRKVLRCAGFYNARFFQIGATQDSHELLTTLRSIWKEGEQVFQRQSDAPTVIDSIFGFEMLQTLSCKNCDLSLTPQLFMDMKLDFPSKWHPTKSAASPQTSEGQITLQLFPADVQRNLEKVQIVSERGYSRGIGSEMIVEKRHKHLEVDSTQAQRISQTQDVVQSPLQIQMGKSVDSLTEDSISIEDLLLLFSEGDLEWRCSYCGKDQSASQSKYGEQIVGSSKTLRFTTLPPVLTLHLNRTSMDDNDVGIKISCHVRFMEYLDVERFMDLSSLDKGSTLYRLAGVVEHIGEGSLQSGHYIAYVKARRLGNQQEGSSCSSSWFCADDHRIRQVTLEQVLNSEAYILFYERMKDRDISGISSSFLGQTGVNVNPKKVEMTGKVQAENQPSGVGLDLGDKWHSDESRSSDAQGYAIRGIPNLGNTCYMNAVLQCLFVLGKLRERMLAPDCPKGAFPVVLQELFVEASSAGVGVLDPRKVLICVGSYNAPFLQVGAMQDSHEFLKTLRRIWKEGEQVFRMQSDAHTEIDSIFGFEMLQTLSCKYCGLPLTPQSFLDMKLDFPSKWHPTKSAASPQTSEDQITLQLFPADVQRNLEKTQILSERGYSRGIGSEMIVEKMHKPLEVDSTQAQRISQTQDVVQSPLQIQKGKSVDSLTEDSISIEDLLLLFSEGDLEWRCSYCGKDQSASQSKYDEQIVGSSKTLRFTTLPPVLTLHLNRTSMDDNNVGIKISCHVRFMEYLDVERFMDLSSLDKGSTLYRLAGVVEHIGEGSLKSGHYIAYVKARRLGNQQEGSGCSSSWFCADDHRIRQVTLEQVLNSEAYILFYERMKDRDISGIRCQN